MGMAEKEEIWIVLSALDGPIIPCDLEDRTPMTGIDVVDNDSVIKRLNHEIGERYSRYYEFDSHDQACWFNAELMFEEREIMRGQLKQLMDRLDELNDGSFVAEDREYRRYAEMCRKSRAEFMREYGVKK